MDNTTNITPETTEPSEEKLMTLNQAIELGLSFHEKKDYSQAEQLYQQVLKYKPQHASALNLLGILYYQTQRYDLAFNLFNQLKVLMPKDAYVYNNIGLIYARNGQFDRAIEYFKQALSFNPNDAEIQSNLAIAEQDFKKIRYFTQEYQKSVSLNQQQRYAESEAIYKALIEQTHQSLDINRKLMLYYSLAKVLHIQIKPKEAIIYYEKSLEINQDNYELWWHYSIALRELNRIEDAMNCYRKVIKLNPNFAEAQNALMNQLQRYCDWSELPELITSQKALLNQEKFSPVLPFLMISVPTTMEEQLRCAKNYATQTYSHLKNMREHLAFQFNKTPKKKLRIGYASADFYQHATSYLMAELFELHDRSLFEIYTYSWGEDDKSPLRQRIIDNSDHFADIRKENFAQSARRIFNDQIDILIDLKGYTYNRRTEIFALKPAPIQVNYLGFPGTMGCDFIDYIITDRFISPPEHKHFYSEKFAYLPDCYQINDRKRKIDSKPISRKDYGLPDNAFVFCCFNNSYKITPEFFDIWCRLLHQVPNSVLWLLKSNEQMVGHLRQEASNRQIDPNRIYFADKLPLDQHLARHQLADLFLDCLPVSAHTTASDALWAGLPVLTCVGDTFVGRVAGSLLQAMRLDDLITYNINDYEQLALKLAQNPMLLKSYREHIELHKLQMPLFDSEKFTRNLEKCYWNMWDNYLST